MSMCMRSNIQGYSQDKLSNFMHYILYTKLKKEGGKGGGEHNTFENFVSILMWMHG